MKTYYGLGDGKTVIVEDEDGRRRELPLAANVQNHAAQFAWGDGSNTRGRHQLAVAMLYDVFRDKRLAEAFSQRFRDHIFAPMAAREPWGPFREEQIRAIVDPMRIHGLKLSVTGGIPLEAG
jgi:hypothetical protein